MCNSCDCEVIDKCSIRGYMPVGSCCEECVLISSIKCETIEQAVKESDKNEELISTTIDTLEKKIKSDLTEFKNELIKKQKQKIFILQPK